ncbi:hypothetical protein GT204_09905 [Streptomyces sp. SID4919]|uniref:SPW repeat protein n=1 Tax=Streptomyces TaxID=1883 RepID=UPI0008238A09|nr:MULTISPECIES: SPW repeat protein [Streptomyces]MCX4658307.1 SPW repeat protein [Streptomyces uncialis]MYY09212.1 hypothetical protein [Streptomyces sp. SID4919]WST66592.1 SPW repeat protein [Streptomyces uncialis]WTE14781.1 SPW repeat protein [Streptomyces uncialis]SCK41766.1 SPW repeat-containing protein [Streptomyces sp. AmelKG-E11A]
MADVSHHRADITSHPDASEMRARHDRVLGGRDVTLVDGPLFLVGLYCAISPWTVHFASSQSTLATHNLIMGVAIAALAIGFAVMPARMYGLSWAICAMGVWLIVAPWIVGSSPDTGVVINNIVIGALTLLLGLVCTGAAMRTGRGKS